MREQESEETRMRGQKSKVMRETGWKREEAEVWHYSSWRGGVEQR